MLAQCQAKNDLRVEKVVTIFSTRHRESLHNFKEDDASEGMRALIQR
jgi:hypothetical protein